MHGTRSLNLATAVAIVLFEAVRQQQAVIENIATAHAHAADNSAAIGSMERSLRF